MNNVISIKGRLSTPSPDMRLEGDITFSWKDVMLVQRNKRDNAILHFYGGLWLESSIPFKEGRELYLKCKGGN